MALYFYQNKNTPRTHTHTRAPFTRTLRANSASLINLLRNFFFSGSNPERPEHATDSPQPGHVVFVFKYLSSQFRLTSFAPFQVGTNLQKKPPKNSPASRLKSRSTGGFSFILSCGHSLVLTGPSEHRCRSAASIVSPSFFPEMSPTRSIAGSHREWPFLQPITCHQAPLLWLQLFTEPESH